MSTKRDQIFAQHASDIEAFAFDARVSSVFEDMIRRSVPGYASVIAMTGILGLETITPNSRVYDLGCSLGSSLISIAQHLNTSHTPCELIGIDNSSAMIKACAKNIKALNLPANIKVKLLCESIDQSDISNASMVIMNYTLQFIAPELRLALLKKIYAGMRSGGVLLLSEKLQFEDDSTEAAMTKLYYDFKKHNGYSELEISQKRQALEKVLIPETEAAHLSRLKQADFSRVIPWFKCLNFCSFIAYK